MKGDSSILQQRRTDTKQVRKRPVKQRVLHGDGHGQSSVLYVFSNISVLKALEFASITR